MNEEFESKIAIFRNESGDIEVDVKLEQDSVWLTQNQIAQIFGKNRTVISRHIVNIFKEKELDESVCAKFAHTASDGKSYVTKYYNLEMIISVGYRVNSKRGVEFRRWANNVLKEYLIKGYSINQKRIADKELKELKQAVSLLSSTLINQGLVNEISDV